MNWNSLGDFIHMGGYGLYVWGSYFVTALCIAVELLMLWLRKKPDATNRIPEDHA
jgi:heme exporter protein D